MLTGCEIGDKGLRRNEALRLNPLIRVAMSQASLREV
jgi:hypothetical protein